MASSRASVFGEAEDLQAALGADGVVGLLITGRGQFRARLTQVGLNRLQLAAVEEALQRIASIVVPAGMVLVSFPIDRGPSPVQKHRPPRRLAVTLKPHRRQCQLLHPPTHAHQSVPVQLYHDH